MTIMDLAEKFWFGMVGLFVAGIGWLVRRVITNGKQVDMLAAEMKLMDESRKDESERRDVDRIELRDELKELRDDTKSLLMHVLGSK